MITENEIQPIESEHTFYHPKAKLNLNSLTDKLLGNKLLTRDNIRILTYNMFLRPPFVHNNDDDWKDERLEDFIKLLHNYDILCLQEVFGTYNSRKEQLIRAASKNGFFYCVDLEAPPFYSKFIAEGGVIIFSRFPILKYSVHLFPYGVVSDSLSQKGIIYSQIEIGNSKLHLFNTHTQASYNNDLLDLYIATFNTRMDQVNCLGNFISGILKDEYNDKNDFALLCGDMNVDALKYYKIPIKIQEMRRMADSEYDKMIETLNNNGLLTENLYYKQNKHHPVTYADIDIQTGYFDKILTYGDDIATCQSLDYMIAIKPNYNINGYDCKSIDNGMVYNEIIDEEKNIIIADNSENYANKNSYVQYEIRKNLLDCAEVNDVNKNLFVIPESIKVIKHLISEMNFNEKCRTYTQLSDHYGLSCFLKYKENSMLNQKDSILIVKESESDLNENYEKEKYKDIEESNIHIKENDKQQSKNCEIIEESMKLIDSK
mmetsp:Transcript_5573/g.5740  ORF Transcript_5573/g.5740 Transcript_5573/m.5740 type:complete len:488 (-) Transcript_5573:97-1560(-)